MWFGIPMLIGERMGDRGEKETEESVPFARTCVLPFCFTMQKKAINYTWTKTAKEQYYSLQKQAEVYYWFYTSHSFPLYKHIRHSPNWWFCWKLLWSRGQKEVCMLNLQSVPSYVLWAWLFLSKKNFLNLDFEILHLNRSTVLLSSVSSILFLPIG